MSQRKQTRRSSGKSKPRHPKDEAADQPINGALIALSEDGSRQLQVLGTAKLTELPTVLRLVAKDIERELGIE